MLQRNLTILVVDDEFDVLEIETLWLAELGYNVIPSSSASEALAIVASDTAIDMVLTDLVMLGDIDGWRLAEQVHALRPNMKVAFTSGYVKPSAMAKMEALGEPVLGKPWHSEEVAEFVRRVLAC